MCLALKGLHHRLTMYLVNLWLHVTKPGLDMVHNLSRFGFVGVRSQFSHTCDIEGRGRITLKISIIQ